MALADPSEAGAAGAPSLLEGKSPVDGRPAAYLCEGGTCRPPVLSPSELKTALLGPLGSLP